MSGSSSVCDILDLPDEMLVEIILLLNARERVLLGNSCKRFHRLVFDEKKSLRCLDFSSEGYLTLMSEVRQYFNAKNKYEHIRKINISNVYCTRPRQMLQNIGKAKNLVEVDVTGFKFKDVNQLASFLTPFEGLRKLSIDWPTEPMNKILCCRVLEGRFKQLTHLKIVLCDVKYKKALIHVLELCKGLEELYLLQIYERFLLREDPSFPELKRLEKLKIVAVFGTDTEFLRQMIVHLLPEPERWAEFKSHSLGNTEFLYYEKSPEVSQALRSNVLVDSASSTQSILFEPLLKEVIRITDQTAPKEFCCLSRCPGQDMSLLRMKDVKLLLKNPRHKIPYLNLNHNIEPECDVHLVALAFPGLTKLVLSNIIKSKAPIAKTSHVETGFKRKRLALEKRDEASSPNSSFKKLVENTPHLKDLTVCASALQGAESWDLTALCFIAGWESLTTLCLAHLPIRSGQFLVEIGKRCKNLEKLRLESLGPRGVCCYKNELLQMLAHSLNLKDLSIQQDNLGQVSHVFTTLAENVKLRRVCVKSLGKGNIVDNLTSSVERLARSSCTLVLLVCEIEGMTQIACDKLKSTLQRLKDEFKRRLFQFEIIRWNGFDEPVRNLSLHFVHKDLLLPHRIAEALYRLDCL